MFLPPGELPQSAWLSLLLSASATLLSAREKRPGEGKARLSPRLSCALDLRPPLLWGEVPLGLGPLEVVMLCVLLQGARVIALLRLPPRRGQPAMACRLTAREPFLCPPSLGRLTGMVSCCGVLSKLPHCPLACLPASMAVPGREVLVLGREGACGGPQTLTLWLPFPPAELVLGTKDKPGGKGPRQESHSACVYVAEGCVPPPEGTRICRGLSVGVTPTVSVELPSSCAVPWTVGYWALFAHVPHKPHRPCRGQRCLHPSK